MRLTEESKWVTFEKSALFGISNEKRTIWLVFLYFDKHKNWRCLISGRLQISGRQFTLYLQWLLPLIQYGGLDFWTAILGQMKILNKSSKIILLRKKIT